VVSAPSFLSHARLGRGHASKARLECRTARHVARQWPTQVRPGGTEASTMAGLTSYRCLEGLRPRRSRVEALRGVSLQIAEGEFLALVGPSVPGKSTLNEHPGCLDRPNQRQLPPGGRNRPPLAPTSGPRSQPANRLSFRTSTCWRAPPPSRTSSCRSCTPRPCPHASAGMGGGSAQPRGLGDRLDHHPGQLSGGQQQRVASPGAREPPVDPDVRRAEGKPRYPNQP